MIAVILPLLREHAVSVSGVSDEAVRIACPADAHSGIMLKTGISYVLSHFPECDTFVTADESSSPEDIRTAADALLSHPDALVLGVRSLPSEMPVLSRMGIRITKSMFAIASGSKLADIHTPLRAFGAPIARKLLNVSGSGNEYGINVLMTAIHDEIPLREVPVRQTLVSNVRASLAVYFCILKFFLSSFASFLIDTAMFMLSGRFISSILTREIFARVISASFNFTVNKNVVFKGNEKTLPALVKYACLAIFILGIDYAVVSLMNSLRFSELLGKIIAQTVSYAVSLPVQGLFVYRRKGKRPQ